MYKNKMILLITNHADDIYCFRKELVEDFIKRGYELIISCPYGDKLELMGDLSYTYIKSQIDRRGMDILADLKLLIHYFKIIKKHKPDVVLTYTIKPNIYASFICSWLKIPYINNVTGLGSIIGMKGFIKKLIVVLCRYAFKRSHYIFFQNQENIEMAKSLRLITGKYKLIPGSGVNVDRFPVESYPETDLIIFNYIGRVLREKGIDDYIEAARRIKLKYPLTEFNVLGFIEPTEWHYTDLFEKLQKDQIIIYRGNQKDIRPFITRSHCTIHPSKYGEGMSNVLLESASSGRPLITTDIAGCRETVDIGVSGFIYHAGDIDDLVEKIESFLHLDNSVRILMGLCGRRKVEKEFNRKIVIEEYNSAINSIDGQLQTEF